MCTYIYTQTEFCWFTPLSVRYCLHIQCLTHVLEVSFLKEDEKQIHRQTLKTFKASLCGFWADPALVLKNYSILIRTWSRHDI